MKEKARELGLEKLVKSGGWNVPEHISRHFDNRSYAEMACDLGISRTTVSRMARKLGLSRSKAKGYAMSSRVRNELVRRERPQGNIRPCPPHTPQSHLPPRQGQDTLPG